MKKILNLRHRIVVCMLLGRLMTQEPDEVAHRRRMLQGRSRTPKPAEVALSIRRRAAARKDAQQYTPPLEMQQRQSEIENDKLNKGISTPYGTDMVHHPFSVGPEIRP